MYKITPKEINGWLNPWPISPEKKREWDFNIIPLKEVLKWKNPNKLPNVGRISFKQIATMMQNETLTGLQDHYIKVLAKDYASQACGLVILVLEKDGEKIVFDGSHRLTAIAYALQMKMPVKMTHVGVLTPKNEKVGKKRKKR